MYYLRWTVDLLALNLSKNRFLKYFLKKIWCQNISRLNYDWSRIKSLPVLHNNVENFKYLAWIFFSCVQGRKMEFHCQKTRIRKSPHMLRIYQSVTMIFRLNSPSIIATIIQWWASCILFDDTPIFVATLVTPRFFQKL